MSEKMVSIHIHTNPEPWTVKEVYIGNFVPYTTLPDGTKHLLYEMVYHHNKFMFTMDEAVRIAKERFPDYRILTDDDSDQATPPPATGEEA